MNGYTGILTVYEKVDLIADELGYSLSDLAQAKRQAGIVEEQQRRAQLEEEQRQQQIRKLERAKARFIEDFKEGKCVVFMDGKHVKNTLCTAGDPNIDNLVRLYGSARQALIMRPKTFILDSRTAASIERDLQCTCGKTHKIRVFVSSDK